VGRKRLLTILAGVVAAIGVNAGVAAAVDIGVPGVGSVAVDLGDDAVVAEVALDIELGDEKLTPVVTAKVSPSGPEVAIEPEAPREEAKPQPAPTTPQSGSSPRPAEAQVQPAGAVDATSRTPDQEHAALRRGALDLALPPAAPAQIEPRPFSGTTPAEPLEPPVVAPPSARSEAAAPSDAVVASTPADRRADAAVPLALQLLAGALVLAAAATWSSVVRRQPPASHA
jgi:hypothetical protein